MLRKEKKDGWADVMERDLQIRATLVADEFIDRYMPDANGEYVKVYLYLLRHYDHVVTVTEAADALNDTESDIRRALAYWEKVGVLEASGVRQEAAARAGRGSAGAAARESAAGRREGLPAEEDDRVLRGGLSAWEDGEVPQERPAARGDGTRQKESGQSASAAAYDGRAGAAEDTVVSVTENGRVGAAEGSGQPDARIPAPRPSYTPEQVKKLSEDEEEFTQLLYVAQKYLNRVFTYTECEVFAYLYDSLRLPAELLEYLVEYCVTRGHNSIRYLETVGLNWHEKGINTVERAKQYTAAYSNEVFAVMRAFGLSDRQPGSSEMEMIQRWFQEWGFTKGMVLEACARTLSATNKPSFAYADRILMEWKKAGAQTMEDVYRLDEARQRARSEKAAGGNRRQSAAGGVAGPEDRQAREGVSAAGQAPREGTSAAGQGSREGVTATGRGSREGASAAGRGSREGASAAGRASRGGASANGRGASRGGSQGARNRFHNFEQRDTDYDAIVLRQVRERLGKQ